MIYSLLVFLFASSISALRFFGFCPRHGLIRLTSRHHRHLHFGYPEFRKFRALHHSTNVFENGVHDAENVFHLLKSLPRDCFTYEASDYTYEYCHMESARQLAKETKNNLREEYNLGAYCPQRSIQKYSPLLRLAKISLVDGDLCPDGAPRKTKVKFFCADPKLSMHIVSAREKSTCNYRILVHVPELCFK